MRSFYADRARELVDALLARFDLHNVVAVLRAHAGAQGEAEAAFAKIVNIFPSTKASANDPYFSKSDGTVESDAKVLAFESLATNLVAGDANGTRDIFLRAPPWQ